jgi:pimeloyl-ACP methyl ester carboxylesterase
MKILKAILFIFFAFVQHNIFSQNVVGNWYSKAVINNKENHFSFQIFKTENSYTGIVDFLSEQKFRVRMDTVNVEGNEITLKNKELNFKFTGKIDSNKNKVKGFLSKKDFKDSIILTRYPQAERTQIVQEPIPYISENVTFYNKENTKFSGTITYPKKGENLKAVILISGSGAQNRDSEILGHKPFEILADYLTRRGVVVLRYDDRGYGKSEGVFRPATTMDYAYDALGALEFLKKLKKPTIQKIGLIGHSEGGNIAPLVATIESCVDFLVLLSAPGTSNYEFMINSLNIMFKEQYLELRHTHVPFYKQVYKNMSSINDKTELKDTLRLKFRNFAERLGKKEYGDYGGIDNYVNVQTAQYTSNWWHYFLQFDVTTYLSQLKIPILALNGNKDTDVESKSNLNGIRNTLKKSGNENFKIVELKNVNHFFQVSKDNKIENLYFNTDTFSKVALKEIGQWIKKL